jgi:hypothetical protein
MSELVKKEDEWGRKATSAAITSAREVVESNIKLTNAIVGKLSDVEWGWIIAAAIFGWIKTRCEQAAVEGLDPEEAVRRTARTPSPGEVAAVHAILPRIADLAAIDWAQPLSAWSKDDMTGFLLLARQLIGEAESAQGAGIIRPSKINWEEGDSIPFDNP